MAGKIAANAPTAASIDTAYASLLELLLFMTIPLAPGSFGRALAHLFRSVLLLGLRFAALACLLRLGFARFECPGKLLRLSERLGFALDSGFADGSGDVPQPAEA